MKKNGNRVTGVVIGLAFAAASLAAPSPAKANVGRMSGTFHVSAEGASTYTVPIWAPKGPKGLEPHIALTYNSQNGGGYMGVGWSVSGLSEIYRCNKTAAQDGAAAAVQLATSDGYCLDGQRLMLTSGTYGTADSTYATEIDNFEQVTAYGAAGNGPGYFDVKDRSGVTYEYGNGGSSQVLANGTSTAWQWWLDKITDTAGNTLTIQYTTQSATGSVVPSIISWTPSGQGSTSYDYTMQFSYGTNTPEGSPIGYVAGTLVSNTNLLESITISYEGTLEKEYFLTYQTSQNTNKNELSQLEECADSSQSTCLSPTTFSYYQNQQGNGVSSGATTVNLGGTANWYLTGYDLNGDGYRDLVFQVGTTWYVAFGSASGYGSPINTGISTPTYSQDSPTLLAGDLLGDGEDELLADNGGTWYAYTWNGSSFSASSTGVAYNASASSFALADTIGDGRPSLVELVVDSSSNPDVYIVPNTSTGSTLSFGSPVLAYTNTAGSGLILVSAGLDGPDSQHDAPIRHLDFDGNGSDDLVLKMEWYDVEDINGTYRKVYFHQAYTLLSHGYTFSGTARPYGTGYFLRWNDSKCTSSMIGSTLYVSGCDGTTAVSYTLPGIGIAAMDWNGGGRDDVLYDSGGYLYVQPSTGSGLGTPFSTGIPYDSSAAYSSADINSDGLDDLLTWAGSALAVNMNTAQGEPIDTVSQITDGYGNWIKPTYASMMQSVNSTYFEWSAPSYPYASYTDPLYIVSQVTYSDPSNPPNGTYVRTHFYAGAVTNLQGRGFSGFGAHQVYDSRSGIWETWGYHREFPNTGILNSDAATENNTSSETIFSRSYSVYDDPIDSAQYNQIYFPYVSGETDKRYQVGGSNSWALLSTTTASFNYDNYGNIVSASTTTTDDDSGSPYDNYSWTTSVSNTTDVDTGTWCLPLLTQTQVTFSDTYDNSSITRTRQFTPDTGSCRYDDIVTEPGTSYQVSESLGYDGFGNINSDTVTGQGMAARVTTANWGTTGQFPMSVTDPAGATNSFSYDFGLGLVSSNTDPNGLTTSWQYSALGRLSQETRSDGTYTTWSRSLYSGSDPLPRMVVTEQSHDIAGNVVRTTTQELDMLDRPYLEQTNLLDGSTATMMQNSYDSLGRVVSAQEPYEGSAVGAVSYSYDVLNRVTEVQRPTSASDSTPATTSYQYQGDTTTITDANGHIRTLVHDVNGWLRQSEGDLGYQVIFGYDAAGSRTSVTDNQGNTLWTGIWAYGVAPFLTGETEMDRGAWGFVVDALGDRTAWSDPKNQHFSEQYDVLSRPVARSEPDLFTQWTWGSSAAAHDIGKLTSVCTGTGQNPTTCAGSGESESWTYDGDGRLSQRAITLPSMGTYTYTWQYNSTTGMPQSLTYPTGSSGQALTLQYAYAYGYLQSITDTLDSPNIVVWKADTMNPAGQVTQDTLGNGIITTRAFDAVTHFLTSVQSGEGGGTGVQNMSFLYDPVGNVSQRQDNNLGLTENFYYDGDDRLSYSTLNGTQNLSMTYDAMGNITNRSDVANDAAWTYDPNHKHQVTEAGSTAYQYIYDANGNMTSRAGSSITWTSYNYPSAVTDSATGESVTFQYGPSRNPWLETTQESSGATETYRLGSLMDIVVGGSGTTDRDYVYAGNEPVAVDERTSSSNSLYYFQTDQQGSISSITNDSGQVVVNESFAAYGARRNPTTWSGLPSSSDIATIAGITQHGYTFQRALGEQIGLNEMVGRTQDAIIGRFISADPYVTDPQNAQDWNPYSYVYNNPLTYVDPSGFTTCGVSPVGNDVTVTVCAQHLPAGIGGSIAGGAQTSSSADPGGQNLQNKFNNLGNRLGKPKKPQQQSNPSALQTVNVTATYEAQTLQGVLITSQASWWTADWNLFQASWAEFGPAIQVAMVPEAGAVEGAAEGAAVDANKLNHIFGNPVHNLEGVVQQFGSQEAAYSALNQAVVQQLGTGTGTFSTVVNIGGTDVTVAGAYVGGVPRIGTAYVQ